MPLPPRTLFTLPEIARRWGVGVHDLGCYAIEETLHLSTVVNGIDAEIGRYVEGKDGDAVRVRDGRRSLSGVHHVFGYDVWPVFTGESTVIRRLRADEPDVFIEIDEPAGGLEIGLADLVIAREERERFEAAHGLNGVATATPTVSRRAGPGRLPRHDWDGFWIAVCTYIHDNGWPETQAALVRNLMDELDGYSNDAPDESTVRKKVSRLWKSGLGA